MVLFIILNYANIVLYTTKHTPIKIVAITVAYHSAHSAKVARTKSFVLCSTKISRVKTFFSTSSAMDKAIVLTCERDSAVKVQIV